MKNILLLIGFTFLGTMLWAQLPDNNLPRGNSKITGIVMDSLDNVPVQFATIAIINPETKKPIDGTVADDGGNFNLVKVPTGEFDVEISFVGYQTKIFHVNTSDKREEINLGIIKLNFEASFLKDVVVEGQRSIIEEKVDRTVYNAENDKTTAGGDASDVLRRVPMLSVDLDGNVSMRGNSNVKVLINNKPSTIMASSVSDALKQIPADMIKSVEVITSPSAKYDAEGSAGIINIITKKNTLQGATLNVNGGAGYRGSNLGLNGSYRTGKMGFNLGGYGRSGYNVRGSFKNSQVREGATYGDPLAPTSTVIQSASTLTRNIFGRYQLGWDYDINKNNTVAASIRYGVRNNRSFQNNLTTDTYDASNNLSETVKQVDTKGNSGTVDFNLDYTHLYKKPQRELSFMTLYSRNNNVNNFTTLTTAPTIAGIKNTNPSFNQEITLQADYQTPVLKTQMLELGGKNISRTVSSNYAYSQLQNGSYVPITSGNVSNIFNYNQNITASYLSYTYNSKVGYSLKAGGRYEYTTINANFANTSESQDVSHIPAYGVFVPSLNLSKKLKGGNTIKAAYNRRIQRPSIQYLNPNVQRSNPLLQTQGNPNLSPEYTDNYELSYSQFIKSTTLNFAGFFRNTTGSIQGISQTRHDSLTNNTYLFTTYQNIGIERAYGLNFFGNVNIGKKFSLNAGSDLYYTTLSNNKPDSLNISNAGWVVSGRMFGNYSLNKGWGLQFFGFIRGRQVTLQGYQGSFKMYSLAVRKEFNEKKGSIGFGLENFLTNGITIKSKTETKTYNVSDYSTMNQNSTNIMRNLNFRINFSYSIGKMSLEDTRRRTRRSVNNDDLKSGGDNGGGGGMDVQQGGQQVGGRQGGRSGAAPAKAPVVKKKKEKKKKDEKIDNNNN